MKIIPALIILIILSGCNQQKDNAKQLLSRVDSLENKLVNSYKPGLGEFMSEIQAHHSKLWFAGQNENWKLADFEVHEIMEAVDDIQKYQTDRKESKMTAILTPVLDSINYSIEKRDLQLFKSSYSLLTNTCNNCHRVTNFEFNVVKIPDTQSFTNQEFKISR